MRVLIWIAEGTWEACVELAGPLLPADAEITLLHVAAADAEAVAAHGRAGLLGRHPPRRPEPEVATLSEREGRELLGDAQRRLGRDARLESRHGRVEREVVRASADADLLIFTRDGAGEGPKSFGPRGRFVVDHVLCPVLVLPRQPAEGRSPLLPPLPSGGR